MMLCRVMVVVIVVVDVMRDNIIHSYAIFHSSLSPFLCDNQNKTRLFLMSSQILEMAQRRDGVFGGCVMHKQRCVCVCVCVF